MMKIYLRTRQGEVVGITPETNLTDFMAAMSNDFVDVRDPVNANIIQTHVMNDAGEIQLVDGRWVDQATAQRVGPQGLMLKNVLRMVALKSPVIKVRTSEVVQIRELNEEEGEEYNKGIQSAKLESSKLATNVSSIELPDDLK